MSYDCLKTLIAFSVFWLPKFYCAISRSWNQNTEVFNLCKYQFSNCSLHKTHLGLYYIMSDFIPYELVVRSTQLYHVLYLDSQEVCYPYFSFCNRKSFHLKVQRTRTIHFARNSKNWIVSRANHYRLKLTTYDIKFFCWFGGFRFVNFRMSEVSHWN